MGTINASGNLIIRASAVLGDTKLAKIVKLVEDAQLQKAPIAKIVDRIYIFGSGGNCSGGTDFDFLVSLYGRY